MRATSEETRSSKAVNRGFVSQEPRIEIFRRTVSGTWEYFEIHEGTVRLASGAMFDLSTLYADLPV